ncbi:MAG TPA: hypothetical protein VF857_11060 [Spirochaetota bacterium]
MKGVARHAVLFLTAILFVSGMGCSYVMDSVEGAITKRSSFSVGVSRTGNQFTLDWSKDKPSINTEAFAGYEIYITDEANNEFAGYELLLSGHPDSKSKAGNSASLLDPATSNVTFTYNVSSLSGQTYFFRVGVIYWDEEKEADRSKNWTTAKGYSFDWNGSSTTVVQYFYPIKSKLDKISGGTMVQF